MSADRDPGDGLQVRGGAGGTEAWVEDLEATATRLSEAGHDMAGAAARLLEISTDPGLAASCVVAPATGVAAEVALARALAGPSGLAGCAVRVGGLGAALRTAAELYRVGDAAAAQVVRRLVQFGGAVLPLGVGGAVVGTLALGPQAWPGLVAGGARLFDLFVRRAGAGDALGAVLPPALHTVAVVLGPLAGSFGLLLAGAVPSDQRRLIVLLSRGGAVAPVFGETGRVRAAVGAPVTGRASSGLDDLLTRTASLYALPDSASVPGPDPSPSSSAAAEQAGTIRVERVTGADGARSWVVMIPGTQRWSPQAGSQPFDLTADLHALDGRTTAVAALVSTGLRRCGARPDEPVLLVGHSLGGIVAAQLATDPAVRRQANITHVVTAGSPIGNTPVPAGVRVLSLEHQDDAVPWADGARNPDRPGWVTVRAPSGVGATGAHELARYAETAAAVEASHDPSLVRARGELAGFLDRPGATSTTWLVSGERIVTAGPSPGRG